MAPLATAIGFIPLKSNGHGGSKVIVVAVLLRTLNTPPMFLIVSGKPPKLCAHVGVAGRIEKSLFTAKFDVLETVMALLPLVAPAVIDGPLSGGGQGDKPRLVNRCHVGSDAKNRLPLSGASQGEVALVRRIDRCSDLEVPAGM